MASYVLYVEGQPRGRPIPSKGLRAGRDRDNDVILSDGQASRHHLFLWVQGGQVYVRDEGSTNGTWVGEERVAGSRALQPDEVLRVGNTHLRVAAGAAPAVGSSLLPALLTVGGVAVLVLVVLVFALRQPLADRQGPESGSIFGVLPASPAVVTIVPPGAATGVVIEPTSTGAVIPTATEHPVLPTQLPASMTPSPAVVYAAPVLLEPDDQVSIAYPTTFRWTWGGTLQADEYFDVRVWRTGMPHNGMGWTKETSYLYDPRSKESGEFFWSVTVIRGRDGKWLGNLSDEAPPRRFTSVVGHGGGPSVGSKRPATPTR